MVVVIDANVIIDFLTSREPYFSSASKIIEKCIYGDIEGYVAFHSISNMWYILRKIPEDQRRKWLESICTCLKVVGASHDGVVKAIRMREFKDFEDCLQDRCAEEINAEYIVTRNVSDYAASKIPAIEPQELLIKFKS